MKNLSYAVLIGFSAALLADFVTNSQSNWLASIEAMGHSTGHFVIKESKNQKMILQWDKMNIVSDAYRTKIKKLSDIIVSAYVPLELDFLRHHPGIVKTIDFFKPFSPYFAGGIKSVNWGLVTEKVEQALRTRALQEPSQFFDPSDIALFVVIKKIDGTPLGFVQFTIRSQYPFGTVQLESMAIIPEERHHGFGKLLVSSIFKIIPDVEHIFLYTRPTNELSLKAYLSYGFYRSTGVVNEPLVRQGYTKMEYSIYQSNILQQASQEIR